ncbi:7TMR-DISM family protein [Marinobacter bryozoorum]|uniref:7TMR-DISM family protein n=1 Tax=Marinobacter bryozoorum TaxID=256324 RepID=UPI0031F37C4A
MQRTAIVTSLLVILCLCSPASWGTSTEAAPPLPVEYLRLPPGQATLAPEEALSSSDWQPLPGTTPNFGYETDTFWYRIDLPPGDSRQILEIAYPHLDDIRFWLVTDGEPGEAEHTGDRLPFSERPLTHPNFLFPVIRQPGTEQQILLRVQTGGAHHVPLQLLAPRELFLKLSREDQLHSLYYGTLVTITLFSLLVFISLREKIYLYYLATTASFLLLLAALRGITYPVLWPASPLLQNYSILIAIPLALISIVLFSRTFLRLKQVGGWIYRAVQIALYANLLALTGVVVLDYNLSIWFSVSVGLATCLLLALCGPILWLRGHSHPASTPWPGAR